MTTIAAVNTGAAGTIYIDDDGYTVSFLIQCRSSATSANGKSWSGNWNGNGLSGTFSINGVQTITVWSGAFPTGNVSFSFTMGATGTSGLSGPTTVTASISRATVPAAPNMQFGQINPDQLSSTGMRVRFSGNSDGGSAITGWELQRATNPSFTTGVQNIASTGTTVYTDMTPNTQYWFRARGSNAVGWGPYSSDLATATTFTVPDKPTHTVTSTTATTVNVTQADPAFVGGTPLFDRIIQISTVSDFSTLVASWPGVYAAWTAANGITRNSYYYVRGRVANAVGWSAWSDTVTAQTPVEAPSAPTGYSATDIASTTAYVSLPAVADNGGSALVDIRYEYNTAPNSTGSTIALVGGFRQPFLQGLAPGTLYYVRLLVGNSGFGGGPGPYGAWVSFTTRGDVPSPPQSLAASLLANTTARLSWAAPVNLYGATVLGYGLRIASDPAFAKSLQSFSGAGSPLDLTGLQPGTTYYAQAWANTSNGFGSYSAPISFLTTGTAPAPSATWTRVAGSWRPGTLFLKVAGSWRAATPWIRVAGIWRKF